VQTTLLKVNGRTEVRCASAMDLQGQSRRRWNSKARESEPATSNRHILFVVSGAFERLKEQVSRGKGQIGFKRRADSGDG